MLIPIPSRNKRRPKKTTRNGLGRELCLDTPTEAHVCGLSLQQTDRDHYVRWVDSSSSQKMHCYQEGY